MADYEYGHRFTVYEHDGYYYFVVFNSSPSLMGVFPGMDLPGGEDHREFESEISSDNRQSQWPFAMVGSLP